MMEVKNILVPTDFSELSDKALAYAADIAQSTKAKLYVLHVIEIVQQCTLDYCLDSDLLAKIESGSVAAAQEMIRKEVLKLSETKSLNIQSDIKMGTPSIEILKEQTKNNIDLIVLGAHKKKKFINYFLGSVADKVTRGAQCPVLLIKS
jgi:nucleotide-binding universal stress UspA family protein